MCQPILLAVCNDMPGLMSDCVLTCSKYMQEAPIYCMGIWDYASHNVCVCPQGQLYSVYVFKCKKMPFDITYKLTHQEIFYISD